MRILGIALILSALLIASVPATPGMADGLTVTRTLPEENLYPDDVINVTIQFTAPDNNFNSIGITDIAPDGWEVSVNTAWCTPAASLSNTPATDTTEYIWLSSFSAGTVFTVVYEVTVPTGTIPGTYIFPDGSVEYYLSGDGPYIADITGDTEVTVTKTDTPTENTVDQGDVSVDPPGDTNGEAAGSLTAVEVIEVEPTPTAFSIISLVITPNEVNVGDDVNVTVRVENAGELDGEYQVICKVDGVVVEEKGVTLAGGTGGLVSFMLNFNEAGIKTIQVNELSGSLVVNSEEETSLVTNSEEEINEETGEVAAIPAQEIPKEPASTSGGYGWLVGLVMGLSVVSIIAVYFIRRNRI